MPWGAISPYMFWSQVPLANRTVTITTNNDKTGYSLTAGSYSVRASSTQRGLILETAGGVGFNTATISPVTTTRAMETHNGAHVTATLTYSGFGRIDLTNSTTVTLTREDDGGLDLRCTFTVYELF